MGKMKQQIRPALGQGLTGERCHDRHTAACICSREGTLRMLLSQGVGGANQPSAFRRNFFPVYGLQRPGAYIYFPLELLFGSFYSRQGRDPELPNLFLELQLHLLLAALSCPPYLII